ncbi:MAG TPA: AAA family ATPase [Verrucomicrobiae bacterium]|nr:AAA family ATPase [Verrucomicrobiae bacterium]
MAGKAFIVGIAGMSGTGKSTLAREVASALNGHTLSMEKYSLSPNGLSFEQREKLNYDEPEIIDVELLEKHIVNYANGDDVEAPIYDFANHLRVTGQSEHIQAGSLLIVEGILALHFPELRAHFDLSIYLEAPADVCFHRRQVRDITERQRSLELIRWQYENTVMPAARRYVLASKRFADIVMDCRPDVVSLEAQLKDAILQRRARAAVV